MLNICRHIYAYIDIYICTCTYVRIYNCIYIYAHIYICIYKCTYRDMYIQIYIYIWTHTHASHLRILKAHTAMHTHIDFHDTFTTTNFVRLSAQMSDPSYQCICRALNLCLCACGQYCTNHMYVYIYICTYINI